MKNTKKEYANAGIPFVSAEWNIDSKNVVVYGHSSKWNNIIFTPLMNYVNQSYYKDHHIFHFTTENETRTYQIFTVLNVDLNNLDGDIPIFLKSFLNRNPNIKTIVFHLDNDEVGTSATTYIMNRLKNKYHCVDQHPTKYKDVNEKLVNMKGAHREQTI